MFTKQEILKIWQSLSLVGLFFLNCPRISWISLIFFVFAYFRFRSSCGIWCIWNFKFLFGCEVEEYALLLYSSLPVDVFVSSSTCFLAPRTKPEITHNKISLHSSNAWSQLLKLSSFGRIRIFFKYSDPLKLDNISIHLKSFMIFLINHFFLQTSY